MIPPTRVRNDADDVTLKESRDKLYVTAGLPPTAIDSYSNVVHQIAPTNNGFSPDIGESTRFPIVTFCTPVIGGIPSVIVYDACIEGKCDCCHLIGDLPAQLKPCRAAQFLFGEGALDDISEDERIFLWQGLVQGFKIVDPDCPASYQCSNYESITGDEFRAEMTTLLLAELETHKVSRSTSPPVCTHALGAVKKSDGRLRPITDCSRPDGGSINNYMSTTFESFSYNSANGCGYFEQ